VLAIAGGLADEVEYVANGPGVHIGGWIWISYSAILCDSRLDAQFARRRNIETPLEMDWDEYRHLHRAEFFGRRNGFAAARLLSRRDIAYERSLAKYSTLRRVDAGKPLL
jgi:hypothetical protein